MDAVRNNSSEVTEDSYCGLYCGACEILVAYLKAESENRKAEWSELPTELTSTMPEKEIRCLGCKSGTVFEGCLQCPIRPCARDKQVDSCADCDQYPCRIINEMKAIIEKIKQTKPHTTSIISNLEEIREQGKAAWMQQQKKLWTCPVCGARLSWYRTECQQCKP